MQNDNQQITPEQYMLNTLKRQIGERYASYEEALAGLQTQLAMAQQRIDELEARLQEDSGDDEVVPTDGPGAA